MSLRRVLAAGAMGMMLAPLSAFAFSWQSVVQWARGMQSEMSAWAVVTRQSALSASVVADNGRQAAQQLATAMSAVSGAGRLNADLLSVDGRLGQPQALLCEARRASDFSVAASEQAARDRGALMSSFAASRTAPGSPAGQIWQRRRASYCTLAEARAGVCELRPNGLQGWDANYAGAFSQWTLAPEAELAGLDFALTVSDVRGESLGRCKAAACASAASVDLQALAASSMAAQSLVGQVTARRVPALTGK